MHSRWLRHDVCVHMHTCIRMCGNAAIMSYTKWELNVPLLELTLLVMITSLGIK